MMVIISRRNEGGFFAIPLGDSKSQYAAVKLESPLQVRNFQMNMPNSYVGINELAVLQICRAHCTELPCPWTNVNVPTRPANDMSAHGRRFATAKLDNHLVIRNLAEYAERHQRTGPMSGHDAFIPTRPSGCGKRRAWPRSRGRKEAGNSCGRGSASC